MPILKTKIIQYNHKSQKISFLDKYAVREIARSTAYLFISVEKN